MTCPIKKDLILQLLRQVENHHNVRILFAVEAGSRTWGFSTPESDYDVRFVYAHSPDWYHSVEGRSDVIECGASGGVDLSGWDVQKALRLFCNSNPGFIEWIHSPTTYIESGQFRQNALKILPKIYSPEKGVYHYRSMAKRAYAEHVMRDVLNSVLRWDTPDRAVTPELQCIIDLVQKRVDEPTVEFVEKDKILLNFIETELLTKVVFEKETISEGEKLRSLNNLFRSILAEDAMQKYGSSFFNDYALIYQG